MDMSLGSDGWGDYYDERGMSGFVQMGSVSSAPLMYIPNTNDVGHGAAYFPGDVSNDALALNYLGFIPDDAINGLAPSTGTQAGDMAQQAGAWDGDFRSAVVTFQSSAGITSDGWIGPQTRMALGAAVGLKNASASPVAPPQVLPPVPVVPTTPIIPISPVPPSPGAPPGVLVQPSQPAAAGGFLSNLTTGEKIGLAVGGVALLGVAWWALK
jgi:hypothetical protein